MGVNNYEAMFLLESGYAAAHWDDGIKEIQGILTKHGSEIIRLVKWDDRKLAYEISHHKRGTYVLAYFKAPGEGVSKIERDVQLSETILRVLVLRHDKVTEEMMLRMTVPSTEPNIIGRVLEPLPVPVKRVAPAAAAAPETATAAPETAAAAEEIVGDLDEGGAAGR
jgi:small subunit ribosomal protein S6